MLLRLTLASGSSLPHLIRFLEHLIGPQCVSPAPQLLTRIEAHPSLNPFKSLSGGLRPECPVLGLGVSLGSRCPPERRARRSAIPKFFSGHVKRREKKRVKLILTVHFT